MAARFDVPDDQLVLTATAFRRQALPFIASWPAATQSTQRVPNPCNGAKSG